MRAGVRARIARTSVGKSSGRGVSDDKLPSMGGSELFIESFSRFPAFVISIHFRRRIMAALYCGRGYAMDFQVRRIQVWSGEVPDRPGAAAAKLEVLAHAGIDLEFVFTRPH